MIIELGSGAYYRSVIHSPTKCLIIKHEQYRIDLKNPNFFVTVAMIQS